MATITVMADKYKVDPLYQWDINQVLTIYGLSLDRTPEIHFSNRVMENAIVRQATMDDAGVVSVDIPNSMLQKPFNVNAFICVYEGDTFKTLYRIEIPLKPRSRPLDYTIKDDDEIYSFNELKNLFNNTLSTSLDRYDTTNVKYLEALKNLQNAVDSYEYTISLIRDLDITVQIEQCNEVIARANELVEYVEEMKNAIDEGKGTANGFATLDESAKVPMSQINSTEILKDVVTVYSGTEEPDNTIGKDGDLYMRVIS